MLYDCFMFFDELELLDLRLHYLDPLIDRFVLVESTRTFSLKDKPLFFDENKSMFSKFLPKIEHVIIDKKKLISEIADSKRLPEQQVGKKVLAEMLADLKSSRR